MESNYRFREFLFLYFDERAPESVEVEKLVLKHAPLSVRDTSAASCWVICSNEENRDYASHYLELNAGRSRPVSYPGILLNGKEVQIAGGFMDEENAALAKILKELSESYSSSIYDEYGNKCVLDFAQFPSMQDDETDGD